MSESKAINTGGRAFPTHTDACEGMALRDYLAAQVLPACYADVLSAVRRGDTELRPGWQDACAGEAYQLADAMIRERAKAQAAGGAE